MTNEDGELLQFDDDLFERRMKERMKQMQKESLRDSERNGLGRILHLLSQDAHNYYTQKKVSETISRAEKGTPLEKPFMELSKLFNDIETGMRKVYQKFNDIEDIKERMRNEFKAAKTVKSKVSPGVRRKPKQGVAEHKASGTRPENKRNNAVADAKSIQRTKSVKAIISKRKSK